MEINAIDLENSAKANFKALAESKGAKLISLHPEEKRFLYYDGQKLNLLEHSEALTAMMGGLSITGALAAAAALMPQAFPDGPPSEEEEKEILKDTVVFLCDKIREKNPAAHSFTYSLASNSFFIVTPGEGGKPKREPCALSEVVNIAELLSKIQQKADE